MILNQSALGIFIPISYPNMLENKSLFNLLLKCPIYTFICISFYWSSNHISITCTPVWMIFFSILDLFNKKGINTMLLPINRTEKSNIFCSEK